MRLATAYGACLAAAFWLALTFSAAAADAPWAVKGTLARAIIRQKEPPSNPDAGTLIVLPDLGVKGGVQLTDAAGKQVPVSVVWRAEARSILLLAQGLQPGQDYYAYLGGMAGQDWNPKVSLVMETRHLQGSSRPFVSWAELDGAWSAATPSDGAEFVPRIYGSANPFGDPVRFLTHYTGYLLAPKGSVELYTMSSDASFVLANGALAVDWPGDHPAGANEKNVHAKTIAVNGEPVKIDYYCAKDSEGPAQMVLGWRHNGTLQAVPPEDWLHPGTSQIVRCEEVHGRPALAPELKLESYFGWGGGFLYEVHCKLLPTNLNGWTVEWQFEDGGVVAGAECTRVVVGGAPMRVTAQATRGAEVVRVAHLLSFYGNPPHEAGDAEEGARKYLPFLAKEDPARLNAAALAGMLPVLISFGEDGQIAPFADAWFRQKANPADPAWLPAEIARLRFLAQKDPKAALAELRKDRQAVGLRYSKELDFFELELLVFYLRDPSAAGRADQMSLQYSSSPEGRLATIRGGDYYRLTGDAGKAAARYQAAQPEDESGGRKLPAQDQAYSMTIQDLISKGDRDEAAAKLSEWEMNHPMAKFSTDFLLQRSRVLMLYGRWREALAELEAFAATHPDSPFQIDADYYRARALYELGNKDEARKIWLHIVKDYPNSELAEPSKEWAAKP